MGKLEEQSQKKTRRRDLQKLILETIKVAGFLSVALVAPKTIGAMDKLGLISKRRQQEYIKSSANRLTRRGLLVFDGKGYKLTAEGEQKLKHWRLADFQLQKPKKWDKKWRVVIFDIPEIKKKVRREIRYIFNQIGMQRLQDSVWAYPYDCEDTLTLIKTELGVGKHLLYLIVEELENDKYLRQEFGLQV